MPIQSVNPANGAVLRTFDALSEPEIRDRIALAEQAFQELALVPLEHRALWMRKLAGLLDDEVEELAATATAEMGKTLSSARAEVHKCADCCRYYADHAAAMLADEPLETPGQESFLRWEPMGVVLAVMPWNFPYWQVIRFLAPALMAGNIGLLKPAPNVPQCALLLQALVRRAGFPRGSLQALLVESNQVESILRDPRVAAVTVTGSEAAGRAVAAQAGWLLKKSVLELGGSDPFIVMPSADLGRAVETAIRSRTVNNGQSCIAAKRFIVHADVYDDFEQRFVTGLEALRVGDPTREETDVGPLATANALNHLEQQVKAALVAGGTLLCGGDRLVGEGNYFEPTAISGLPRTAPVYRDEIFGPVALLFRAHSLEEAITMANDTPFGLAASVWTAEAIEQQRLTAGLRCGAVFINSLVASDPRLPFGGTRRSGYGRELATAGMREFLNCKTVVVTEPTFPAPLATLKIEEDVAEPDSRTAFADSLEQAIGGIMHHRA